MKPNNQIKARLVFLGAVTLLVSPLSLGTRAAETTEKSVAFRTADNHYVTATARGGLNTSGVKIAGNQTFVLVDLNGGELADGDAVQIKLAPSGAKPTYWREGEGSIGRAGGRPADSSTFKIKLKAPQSIVLQTASGKFVSVPNKGAALATTDAEATAATFTLVDIAAEGETPATATTAITTTPAAEPSTPAPAAAIVIPPAPAAAMGQPTMPATQKTSWKFDFGSGPAAPGYTKVLPTSAYSPEAGYGLEPDAQVTAQDRGKPDTLRQDFLTSDKPFLFLAAVPEGNYNVTVTLGDQNGESTTTVKAEQRRLMLENISTIAGKFETRTFTVNVHTAKIKGSSQSVGLKPGEKGPPLAANWDDKLTLEFNGTRPCVAAVEINKVEDALNVFVAGDSTVTDGRREPWAAWGQMLPRFLKPGVAVANYAESGLTLSSFRAQRRLDKILNEMKSGDYVFIQFGHNDQKEKGESAGPFKSYKTNLQDYVKKVREKGGVPVILTPMERRRWSGDKPQASLTDYAEAARQVGEEEKVPVIDLNAESFKLYQALGAEGSKKAFVFFPANTFPGQPEAISDNTHFSNYGAYELARLVVEGIKANVPALAKHLVAGEGTFDPSKPDAFESFKVPFSVFAASEKPDGS